MAGVVGVSAGDVLAFGRLCRDIYNVCFSEARGACKDWESLGNQLAALGHSLDSLYRNTDALPDSPDARLSAQLVIGDFQKTLKDLQMFLGKYGELGNPDPSLWKKIRWSTEQSTVEHIRQRISIHIKGIDMMLNPVMLQKMKDVDTRTSSIQDTVNGIETRIGGIGNVLEALLLVAYEQLPQRSFAQRRQMEWYGGGNGRYLTSTPEHSEDLSSIIGQSTYSGPRLAPIMRGTTTGPSFGPAAQANYAPPPTTAPRSIRQAGGNSSTGQPWPSVTGYEKGGRPPEPTPQSRTYTVDSIRPVDDQAPSPPEIYSPPPQGSPRSTLYDNPLLQRLAEHVERSNYGGRNRIENWLHAGFWWYLRASAELDAAQDAVSKDAYLGLLKSSWIVNNMIRPYDNGPGLPAEIERNVETLSASILQQWQKIKGRQMPDLRNLSSEDFEIWDGEIHLFSQTGDQLRPIPAEISYSVLPTSASPTPSRHNSLPNALPSDRHPSRQDSLPPDRQSALQSIPRRPINAQSPLVASLTPQFSASPGYLQPEHQQNRSVSGSPSGSEAFSTLSLQSSETSSPPGGAPGLNPYPASSAAIYLEPTQNTYNVSPDEGLRIWASYGEDSRIPLGEQPGEEMVLDHLRISFADRYKGPYTEGFARVLWRPDDGYFRVATTWEYNNSARYRSDDVSRVDTELVPEYAYEEKLVIFLRNANQRAPPIDSLHGHPIQPDKDRIGLFYRFHTPEDMLKFQATFTKETVYVDLIKRVPTVTVKKARTGEHTYGYGRVQLSCDQEPRNSDFSDGASMATVTDDITLDIQRDKRIVEIKPARHSFFNNPKYVKARMIGTDERRGGFRLSKHKQAPDDIQNFDDYVYIRIAFRDAHYLGAFVEMWEKMIQSRRSERKRIKGLKATLEARRVEANPGN